MAAFVEIFIEQGANLSSTVTVTYPFGYTVNLSTYSAASQIRKSYYSSNATAIFSTSINVGQGTITLELSSATTANIAAGRYVYDTVISANNTTTRILEGIVDVSPRVTR